MDDNTVLQSLTAALQGLDPNPFASIRYGRRPKGAPPITAENFPLLEVLPSTWKTERKSEGNLRTVSYRLVCSVWDAGSGTTDDPLTEALALAQVVETAATALQLDGCLPLGGILNGTFDHRNRLADAVSVELVGNLVYLI